MTPQHKLLLTICMLQTASCIHTSQPDRPCSAELILSARGTQRPLAGYATTHTDDRSRFTGDDTTLEELLTTHAHNAGFSSSDEDTTDEIAQTPHSPRENTQTRQARSPKNQLLRLSTKITRLTQQISDLDNPETEEGRTFAILSQAERIKKRQELQNKLELAHGAATFVQSQATLSAIIAGVQADHHQPPRHAATVPTIAVTYEPIHTQTITQHTVAQKLQRDIVAAASTQPADNETISFNTQPRAADTPTISRSTPTQAVLAMTETTLDAGNDRQATPPPALDATRVFNQAETDAAARKARQGAETAERALGAQRAEDTQPTPRIASTPIVILPVDETALEKRNDRQPTPPPAARDVSTPEEHATHTNYLGANTPSTDQEAILTAALAEIATTTAPTAPNVTQALTQKDVDAAAAKARQGALNETKNTIRFYQTTTVITGIMAAFNTNWVTQNVSVPGMRAIGKWLLSLKGSETK